MPSLQQILPRGSESRIQRPPSVPPPPPPIKKFIACKRKSQYLKRQIVAEKLTELNESLLVHGKLSQFYYYGRIIALFL